MAVDFQALGLVNTDGIWHAQKKVSISYPDDGNNYCYQIEEVSFWFKHRNNCIKELVKKYHGNNGAFFDIGGGNGYVAKAIEELGIETILVEPGEKGCANAKKRNIKNVVCATIEDAGFKPNSMPAIGVFDVVEHFDDDLGLLKNLNNFLVKNGLIFITVPAFEILWSVDDDSAGHYHRYTLQNMGEKLKKAGFEVVYDTYIFSILPLPVLAFRTLPSKLGIRKEPKYDSQKPNEHNKDSSILSHIWKWEINRLKNGKKIPVGGSCLIVAKKI